MENRSVQRENAADADSEFVAARLEMTVEEDSHATGSDLQDRTIREAFHCNSGH